MDIGFLVSNKLPKIYIAGALNADAVHYLQNTSRMMRWAERVRTSGFAIFVPALDLLMGIMFGNWEYPDYFDNSQSWLQVSDAIFVVPGFENSDGVRRELKVAKEFNIPIFYELRRMCEFFDERNTND